MSVLDNNQSGVPLNGSNGAVEVMPAATKVQAWELSPREPHLYDYLLILRKHQWLILSFMLSVVTIVAIATFRMQPVYVATARIEAARDALDRANELQVGVSITRAELFLAQRDYRIAEAEYVEAEKRLALLNAGSRAEDIAEAQAKRDTAAALLEEGKAELDQCAVRAPAAGTVQIVATVGQFVSVLTQAPLVQLTTEPAAK